MKKFLALIVLFNLSFGIVFALDIYHSEQFYTVKIENTCDISGAGCFNLLDRLVKDGVMAFCVKDVHNGVHRVQIMAGMYDTVTGAKDAATDISAAYGVKCVVGETYDLATTSYKNRFSVINTPGGIWLCENGKFSRIFDYGKGLGGITESADNPVDISPSGNEIVFYFKGEIYKINLETCRNTILVNSAINGAALARSSPKWSYDGKHIAFLDKPTCTSGTCLKVINSDGSDIKFIHDNRGKKETVLSFKWDPEKDVVYFVDLSGERRVPVGGKLLLAGLDGKEKTVIEAEKGSDVDRHFRIEDNKLIFSRNAYSQFDYGTYTSKEQTLVLSRL